VRASAITDRRAEDPDRSYGLYLDSRFIFGIEVEDDGLAAQRLERDGLSLVRRQGKFRCRCALGESRVASSQRAIGHGGGRSGVQLDDPTIEETVSGRRALATAKTSDG
jgi:hypothetical protein